MKPLTTAALLFICLATLIGCVSPPRGAASSRENEFHRQLADTLPMRDYGYMLDVLRFSPDSKKALVVFTHPDTRTRPDWEFVLTEDEFGRYRGASIQPFYTPGTANTPAIQITVSLPTQ